MRWQKVAAESRSRQSWRGNDPRGPKACCIDCIGAGAAAAVAFCDEPVVAGPPPPDLAGRFAAARAVCDGYGIHLVDWWSCDDDLFRSTRYALDPEGEWWDLP